MRIHTDVLTRQDLHNACRADVYVQTMRHGSRSRKCAFECQLRGEGARHTRKPNSGQYGAERNERAATYSDWGFWFASLYNIDPKMKCWAYDGADDFHKQTHGLYKGDGEKLHAVITYYTTNRREAGHKHREAVELTAADWDIPSWIIDRAIQGERASVTA